MNTSLLQSPTELQAYDQWVKTHPHGTLWQSLEWKKYREACGKEVRIYATMEGEEIQGSALVVIDKTSLGLSTWEVPRGPLVKGHGTGDMGQLLLQKVIDDAKKENAFSVYLSPITLVPCHLSPVTSQRHVHPEATRIVNLRLSEAEMLAQMHEKGRYNIKVAQKHGIEVKESQDIDAYFALAEHTGGRDGFKILPKKSYENFLKHLPGSFLLLAHAPTLTPSPNPIAGLLGVIWNGTGIYYYGASDYEHRNLMAPYLLQWEAMRRCKAQGCHSYDLLGIAPPEADPSHPWQGISGFKAKFGGNVIGYPPEQEVVLKPFVKRLLGWKRAVLG